MCNKNKIEQRIEIYNIIFGLGVKDSAAAFEYAEKYVSQLECKYDMQDMEQKRDFLKVVYAVVKQYLEQER